MKAIIVIPTIRDLSFLKEWRSEFKNHKIIVCEDHPEKQIALPNGFQIDHYSWKEIEEELGDRAWIIPHFNASIRSFGYWKAWQESPDLIVTIDDDCFPSELTSEPGTGFLAKHWQNLQRMATTSWELTAPFYTRGFPYEVRETSRTVISHGLWSGIPDLDAPTQLVQPKLRLVDPPGVKTMPRGTYYAMSGMNLAFRSEIAPAMYFLLQGRDWEFDRFDDIWAGVFAKRICDHLDLAVASGEPVVEHKRASNVYKNLQKEAAGIEANEILWRAVDSVQLEGSTVRECYLELANKLPLQGQYWDRLREAMIVWAGLFEAQPTTAYQNGSRATSGAASAAVGQKTAVEG